jgi:acetyl-CoA carboxylase carboxyltransferase component
VSSHYSVMVKNTSQMFVAGPPVVARVEKVYEKNELGGSQIHTRNGAVDDEADSEADAFERVRRFLSYLPANVFELPARAACWDDAKRRDESLLHAVPRNPRQVYKMRPIVESIVDTGSMFEIGRNWGRAVITGLARLDGWPVAVMASDPYLFGGVWDADAAQKIVRFVDLAQTFHLPVVHLVDVPGFKIGLAAEREATIRHGARALAAIWQASVPWASVIVRRAYGVAGAAHQPGGRYAMRLAWPSAQWGSLPIEGGLEAAYKSELEAASDPKAKLKEIEERLNALTSPMRSAESFIAEEIIDPRETRPMLTEWASLVAPLRQTGEPRFGTRP